MTHNKHRCDDDRVRHFSPLLLLLIVPILMFPGALLGPEVVSADDHLSVHHVFQTEPGGAVRHPHLSDPALQFKALRQAVRTAIRHGEVPLWNPDIWAGAPLLGNAQSMVGSPVTWVYLIFGEVLGADLAVLLLLLIVGGGCAALARQLGASHWGATIAGTGGMTAPFVSVWLLHPHAATAAWWPWLLLAIERRSGLGVAMASAAVCAGGHPQTAAHILAMSGLWWIFRSRWWGALYWGVAGLLIAAPIWLPFAEELARSATISHHGGNALAPRQLLDLVWPGWLGHPVTETWTSSPLSWADGRIHPGIGVMLLCLRTIRSRPSGLRAITIIWTVAIGLALVGTLGPINNARLASLAGLLLAVLAGLAKNGRWTPMVWVLVLISGLWATRHDQGTLPPERHDPTPAPWTEVLKETVGEGRIIGLSWAVQPNTGALAGLSDLRGYDLPVSVDTERLQTALNPRPVRPWFRIDSLPSIHLLRFAGVRAVVSTNAIAPSIDLGQAPVFARAVEEALPRAWLATAATPVPTPEASIRRIVSDPSAPGSPPIEGLVERLSGPGSVLAVQNLRHTTTTSSFTTDAPVPTIAVLSDAWHPGWTVHVDGEKATPLRVGGIFRGVRLPAGSHTVIWSFAPWSWRTGCKLFFLGLFAGLMAVVARRHWGRHVN